VVTTGSIIYDGDRLEIIWLDSAVKLNYAYSTASASLPE